MRHPISIKRRIERRRARRSRARYKKMMELEERGVRVLEEAQRNIKISQQYHERVGYALESMSGWRLAWTGVRKIFKGGFSI